MPKKQAVSAISKNSFEPSHPNPSHKEIPTINQKDLIRNANHFKTHNEESPFCLPKVRNNLYDALRTEYLRMRRKKLKDITPEEMDKFHELIKKTFWNCPPNCAISQSTKTNTTMTTYHASVILGKSIKMTRAYDGF